MNTLEDIRNEVINSIGEKAEKFGFPKIAGQLEGLLFLTDKPMSLDEMAERLEVSKASVSTNIRYLEQWKVVRRVYQRGERRNYYEIWGDIWEIETEIASTIVKDEIERFKALLTKSAQNLKSVKAKTSQDKEEVKFIKRRFSEFEEYLETVEYFLRVLLKGGEITPAVIKKIKIT